MFLDDSSNFLTVWRLAHNWVGADPEASDPNALPDELRHTISSPNAWRYLKNNFNQKQTIRNIR
jgi:hypothetical protein